MQQLIHILTPKFNLQFIIINKVFGGLFKQWDETFGSLSFRGTDTQTHKYDLKVIKLTYI